MFSATSVTLSSSDRRAYLRRDCSLLVDCDDLEICYTAQMTNIGLGGAFLLHNESCHVGQELILTIPFKQYRDFLIIPGKVVWIIPNGAGVEFVRKSALH